MQEEAEEFLEAAEAERGFLDLKNIQDLKFYILLIRSNKIRFESIRAVQLWTWEAIHSNFLGFPLFLYILAHFIT